MDKCLAGPIQPRIVVIALPVLLTGGTEMQSLQLVQALANNGYRVRVCCYFNEHDPMMVQAMSDASDGVDLLEQERDAGLAALTKKLVEYFRRTRPDVLHIQYIAPGLVPILAAKLAGIRTVFTTCHQPGRTYGLKAKLFIRIAARLCTAFVCVSRSAEESWFGNSELFNPELFYRNRRHYTIYNAVDIDKINKISGELQRERLCEQFEVTDKKVIGFVGRLRHEKGVDILMNSFPRIITSFPDAVLVVVGDGPDRRSLELRAQSLDIADHLRWVGQKSPEEVYQLYSIMDVVTVPSRFEGFGLVAAEAMAAGLPIVASAVDGLQELVEQGVTGYLVPVNDSSALASRLIELLRNRTLAQAMGIQGQKRVTNLFSLDKFASSICSLYERYVRSI